MFTIKNMAKKYTYIKDRKGTKTYLFLSTFINILKHFTSHIVPNTFLQLNTL